MVVLKERILDKVDYLYNIGKLNAMIEAYYQKNDPIATDEEFDSLMSAVKEYENRTGYIHEVSPTNKVNGSVDDKFAKVKHLSRMWSQQDLFHDIEVKKWLENIAKEVKFYEFVAEEKLDGLSLNLIYKDGELFKAVTRGDGSVGEDVTFNVKYIDGIPLTIPERWDMEIRGEVVIHHKDFIKINDDRSNQGLSLFANARNAASGSLRTLDGNVVKDRKLRFYPWDIGIGKPQGVKRVDELRNYITDYLKVGLKSNTYRFIKLSAIEDIYKTILNSRNKLDYGIDGIVIKNNILEQHESLGYTSKFPKWSCAYKFPAVEKVTTVIDIVNQIGRTGVITPVAILEPIEIDGSVVSRATLHNYGEVERLDLMFRDKIILIKSGDIIPKITKVLKDRRVGNEIKIETPTNCPMCNGKLTQEDVELYCYNEDCVTKLYKKIEFAVGRDYLNIDGLGPSTIVQLVNLNLVNKLSDLFKLTYEDLNRLDGFSSKKIEKLLNSLNKVKGLTLDRIIAAMGYSSIGRTVSKLMVDTYAEKAIKLSTEELLDLDGVGDVIVDSYANLLKDDDLEELIKLLEPTIPQEIVGKYSNMNVVLTGAMVGGKNDIAEMILKEGGTIKSSVTKDTDLVIYGDKPGSKLNKANDLNIATKYYKEL